MPGTPSLEIDTRRAYSHENMKGIHVMQQAFVQRFFARRTTPPRNSLQEQKIDSGHDF
jgi:hypothetical protein